MRIAMLPMPMRERMVFAGAIADRHGQRLAEMPDLIPLLELTRGNPLTICLTVGEAMRTGEQVEAFVAKLRAGEPAFEDEKSEGRARLLGASLRYGFETVFSEDKRKILAVLYLFQRFINAEELRVMGHPKAGWGLEVIRGLTREQPIALLDRAAEAGVLAAYGGFIRHSPGSSRGISEPCSRNTTVDRKTKER